MKKYRVYLETSFINRLADPLKREAELRREQLLSREWWKTSRHKYHLVSSALAFKESCSNYPNRRIVRLRLRIFASLDILSVPAAERDALAAALSRRGGPFPVTELVDAQHLAIPAIGGCRYLLTWNQKHLANPFMHERVDNVFEEASKRVSKTARQAPTDSLADLHAYRRRLAARFNYDAARVGAYIDSLPTPPGSRIIEVPSRKAHPGRKSA